MNFTIIFSFKISFIMETVYFIICPRSTNMKMSIFCFFFSNFTLVNNRCFYNKIRHRKTNLNLPIIIIIDNRISNIYFLLSFFFYFFL